jgi:hypothetical protein
VCVPMDLHISNLLAAVYFVVVATFAAFTGQHIVRRLIIVFGRASLIIFILAFTIFVSAILLGEFFYFLLFRVWNYDLNSFWKLLLFCKFVNFY